MRASVLTGRKLYKKRDFWYAVRYGFELECARRMPPQTGKICRCSKSGILQSALCPDRKRRE